MVRSAEPRMRGSDPKERRIPRTSTMRNSGGRGGAVLLVGNLFEPIDVVAVQHVGDGDVAHAVGCRRAMPMFDVWRNPDHITRLDSLRFAAPPPHPAGAGGDAQGLSRRLPVPG